MMRVGQSIEQLYEAYGTVPKVLKVKIECLAGKGVQFFACLPASRAV